MNVPINAKRLRATLPDVVERVRKGIRYTVIYRSQPAFQIVPVDDRGGAPSSLAEDTLYITIDEKPKQHSGGALKRTRNIIENAAVTVVADRYDEDWSLLGWVMLHGHGEILRDGMEHDRAQALLRSRYRQLETMHIVHHPVIAVRIERSSHWGNLSA